MSGQAPWSIKGIRAETREAAKGLAQRDGLTIGEWMNRLIEEIGTTDDDQDADRQATFRGWPQPGPAPSGLSPFPGAQEQGWSGLSAPNATGAPAGGQDASRLAMALETLTRRLEGMPAAAPGPTAGLSGRPANMSGLDRAMMAIGERMEDSERRTDRTLGQIDASLSELRQTHAAIADRLRRLEESDPSHRSLSALRTLESMVGRMASQMQEAESRTEALARDIEAVKQGGPAGVTAADLEAVSRRTSEGMTTLGDTVGAVAARLGEIETLTTGAIEEADRGIQLLSERVAGAEALAGDVSGRLASLMIDLSARITDVEAQVQSVLSSPAITALQQRMGDIGGLEARFEELDQRLTGTIEATRADLAAAVRDGIDSRFADVAGSLAERLDAAERRTGQAMEKVGGEIARVAASLAQRLQRLEETDAGARDTATAQRLELARITRAIDDRLASLETRDTQLIERAGAQMQQVADQLAQRLDQSERRTLDSVSDQMRALADRLQARQDEVAGALGRRIDEADQRAGERIEERIGSISRDIAAAEDRAKAVSAPLHRTFDTVIDRLDRLENRSLEPFAETVGPAPGPGATNGFALPVAPVPGDGAPPPPTWPEAAQSAAGPQAYVAPGDMMLGASERDDMAAAALSATPTRSRDSADVAASAQRSSAFASPFPIDEIGRPGDPADFLIPSSALPLNSPSLDGGPSGEAVGGPVSFENDVAMLGLDDTFIEPVRGIGGPAGGPGNPATGGDYLSMARQAAITAAQAREADQGSRGRRAARPVKGPKPAKPSKAPGQGRPSVLQPAVSAEGRSRSPVSPVGVVAAAGLVVAGGLFAFGALRSTPESDQPPAVLAGPPEPAPAAPAVSAPASADLAVAAPPAGAGDLDSASPASPPPVRPVVPAAAVTTPAAAPAPAPAAEPAPRAQGSAALRDLQREQEARARAAQQRAAALAARAASPSPVPAPRAAVSRPATPSVTPSGTPGAAARPVPPAADGQARATPATPAGAAPATAPARAVPQRPAAARPAATGAADARAAFDEAQRRQQAGDQAGALALMQRAADGGDTRAQNRLARMYERGEGGVERDMAAARRWTERAAAAGSRQAQHNLGVYYAEGEGTQQDFGRAAENFARAARRGSTDSQYNLGAMSEQGLGRERSDADAYYWYALAARGGDPDAARKAEQTAARLDAAARQAADARVRAFQPEGGGDE